MDRSGLSGSPIDDEDRAALLCVAASFAAMQDELTESLRLSHEALGIYENVASRSGRAEALFRIAEAEHRKGHLDVSESFYREALAEIYVVGREPWPDAVRGEPRNASAPARRLASGFRAARRCDAPCRCIGGREGSPASS